MQRVPIPKSVPVPKKAKPKDNTQRNTLIAVGIVLLLLLLLLLLFLFKPQSGGAGSDGNGSGRAGSENGDTQESAVGASSTDAGQQNEVNPSINEADEKQTVPPSTAGTETQEETKSEPTSALTSKLNEKVPSGSSTGTGDNLQRGDATVSFFGTKGKGNKFVYVIDHSGSMAGTRLEEAKKEMLKGLHTLQSHHRLNVIFYDDSYIVWKQNEKLVKATKENKKDAEEFVNQISSSGGTKPVPALDDAIGCQPDVIFFLTDGVFFMDLNEVVKRAGKIHINVIQLGDGYDGNIRNESQLLKDLAKRTKGDYKFVDVSKLDAL